MQWSRGPTHTHIRWKQSGFAACLFLMVCVMIALQTLKLSTPPPVNVRTLPVAPKSIASGWRFGADFHRLRAGAPPRTDSSPLEMSCKLPSVVPQERDIQRHLQAAYSMTCTKHMSNVAHLDEDNVLTIQHDLDPFFPTRGTTFGCEVKQLVGGIKPDVRRYKVIDSTIVMGVNERRKIPFDQFIVSCANLTDGGPKGETRLDKRNASADYEQPVRMGGITEQGPKGMNISVPTMYRRAFAGFANSEEKKSRAPLATPEAPSLIVLILDSTSRNQFYRHAPKSHELMKKLGFQILNGYNKIADNSGVNLFPIMAGRTAQDQVGGTGAEVVKDAKTLEDFEFIWNLMKKRGCVSMFNDDIMSPYRGLFAYDHHNGFAKPPTDYFFRPFSLFNVRHEVVPELGQCNIHGQSLFSQHLDLFERFTRIFKDHCHFSITFMPTPTHDDGWKLQMEDETIRSILERFSAIGALEKTAVVIMGDHGNRISRLQHEFTGRIEERMPLFALHLPPGLRKSRPDFVENFHFNRNRLTSNYDIYKTLRTIASLGFRSGEQPKPQIQYRGYSLLEERVMAERSCSDAGIPENFCACLTEQTLPKFYRGTEKIEALQHTIMGELNSTDCVKNAEILTDPIRSYTLNSMARAGWRAMDPKKGRQPKYVQFMEFLYHDADVRIQTPFNETLIVRIRMKNDVVAQTFSLAEHPIVLKISPAGADEEDQLIEAAPTENGALLFEEYCRWRLQNHPTLPEITKTPIPVDERTKLNATTDSKTPDEPKPSS